MARWKARKKGFHGRRHKRGKRRMGGIDNGPYGNSGLGSWLGTLGAGALAGISGVQQVSSGLTQTQQPHLSSVIERLSHVEPVKLVRMPDYTATIVGWRGWTLKDGKLSALGMTGIWEPRKVNVAQCTAGGGMGGMHEAPFMRCNCGFWAFRTLEILEEALKGYTPIVIGTVDLWGRLIECKNGWRAQFAYPRELWLLKSDLEHLSWTYGVPVRKL